MGGEVWYAYMGFRIFNLSYTAHIPLGDVCYARFMNQDIIILNSYEAAVELLDRRSATYSGRPRMIMAGQVYVHMFSCAVFMN
jgi:hypothetical protein